MFDPEHVHASLGRPPGDLFAADAHADHHQVMPPRHAARLLWRALGGVHPAMISTGLSKQRQTVTSMTHLRL
jgi:hypothetical protein